MAELLDEIESLILVHCVAQQHTQRHQFIIRLTTHHSTKCSICDNSHRNFPACSHIFDRYRSAIHRSMKTFSSFRCSRKFVWCQPNYKQFDIIDNFWIIFWILLSFVYLRHCRWDGGGCEVNTCGREHKRATAGKILYEGNSKKKTRWKHRKSPFIFIALDFTWTATRSPMLQKWNL